MGTPEEVAQAKRLLASGNVSPAVKQRLEAFVAKNSTAPAPQFRPSPVLGTPTPVVTGGIRNRSMQILTQPTKVEEDLPTSFSPRELRSDFPIMYTEPTSGSGDEGWKKAMERAAMEGRDAYRVSKEWPVYPNASLEETLANAPVRLATDVAGPAIMGAGDSASAGLVTKGSLKALEKGGVLPRGATEEARQMAASSPASYGIGALLGSFGGLAKGVGILAKKAVAPLMTSGAGKAVGYALSGGLAGGLTSGAESLVGQKVFKEDRDPVADTVRGMKYGAGAGLIGGGLQELGSYRYNTLRDPMKSDAANDLALAEGAGAKTDWWSGVKPDKSTPQGQALADDLSTLSQAARKSGQKVDALAAERAAGTLGQTLDDYHQSTLRDIDAQNQSVYSQGARVSAEPLVRKNLELLRKASHPDGTELPGHVVSGLAKELPKVAEVKVVPSTSPEAHAVTDSDFMMPAATAKQLGIVRGAVRPGDVVIVQPRNLSAEELDAANRMYFNRANLGEYDPATAPLKELGHAGVVNRGRFGPGVERMKAAQSKALGEMKNSLEAAGLSRETSKVDLGDVGTRDALYQSARRYKTGASIPKDQEIDRLAGRNPALRTQLDQSAAVGAMQRLKAQATPNVQVGMGGNPYGRLGGLKLRLDPIMGALSHLGEYWPGLPAGVGAARKEQKK